MFFIMRSPAAVVLTAIVMLASFTLAHIYKPNPPIYIQVDLGGGLLDYLTKYSEARKAGQRFVIDGLCVSACTLITGEIREENVCVTRFAKLGFHAAFNGITGEYSEEGTKLLWQIYPQKVWTLLNERGWAGPTVDHPDVLWVEGDDLLKLFRPCSNY
jgi:hypothetical protein